MNREETYDDYLRSGEHLLNSFGFIEDDETLERCQMCGDYHPIEDFDSYKDQRMCPECIELERANDAATSLSPCYSELFGKMGNVS